MRKNLMSAAMLMAVACTGVTTMNSCTSDENNNQVTEQGMLQINPFVCEEQPEQRDAGFTAKTQFELGDKLGVFVGLGTPSNTYPNTPKNIETTMAATLWEMQPLALQNLEATIGAYFPYKNTSTDADAIPVEIASNTDYLWGISSTTATFLKPNVDIPMKHAMSQFVIRLTYKDERYVGQGNVSSIKLTATNATTLWSQGTMKIDGGAITGTTGVTSLTYNPTILNRPAQLNETIEYNCIMIPTRFDAGVLTLTMVVDGNTFTFNLPAGEWKAGFRNIYNLDLVDNSISIGGGEDGEGTDGITIEAWSNGNVTGITLTPIV